MPIVLLKTKRKCSSCKELLPYHRFSSPVVRRCRDCTREYNKQYYESHGDYYKQAVREWAKNNRARKSWLALNKRAGNKYGDLPTYAHVEVRMTWEEFEAWFNAHWFEGGSVDRVDNAGHYELDNIQMLPLAENRRKHGHNYFAPEGKHWCAGCKTYLDYGLFHRQHKGIHGLRSHCKECRKVGGTAIESKEVRDGGSESDKTVE